VAPWQTLWYDKKVKRYFLLVFGLILTALPAQEQTLETLIQEHRTALGFVRLGLSDRLSQSATEYARKLAQLGYLTHRDEFHRGPEHRASVMGIGTAGEILGLAGNAVEVFRSWLNSPGHKRVLDGPHWTRYGIGRAVWRSSTIFVVIFWYPAS